MKSSLRERLARLGPIRAIDRLSSGFPVEVVLDRAVSPKDFNTIAASHGLAYYGMTLLAAKRAVEEIMFARPLALRLPLVDDLASMQANLRDLGFSVRVRGKVIDFAIADLRARLGMTQEEFALAYGLELRTLQKWERSKALDRVAVTYLKLIEKNPQEIKAMAEAAL